MWLKENSESKMIGKERYEFFMSEHATAPFYIEIYSA